MSVRPITKSEELYASGYPWVSTASLFGASQGLLYFFVHKNQPATTPWFTSSQCYGKFALFVFGGYLIGGTVSYMAFKNPKLQRL